MRAVVGEAAAAPLPSCEKGFSYKISFGLILPSCLKEVTSTVKQQQRFPGGLVGRCAWAGQVRGGRCAGCGWPRRGASPPSALSHPELPCRGLCPHPGSLLGTASTLTSRRPTKRVTKRGFWHNPSILVCHFRWV